MQEILPIHFAPLQGYTEAIYRNAHATCFGGVDIYYTPFVRLEKGNFRKRDIRDIEPDNNHVPHLVPQLLASSPEKAETILSLLKSKMLYLSPSPKSMRESAHWCSCSY